MSENTSSAKRCKAIEGVRGVVPGWGCCCHANGWAYNNRERTHCKFCGHKRCDLPQAVRGPAR